MTPTIWTIGHSTRAIDMMIALLNAYAILRVVDVRAFPYSPRNPQFHTAALARSLEEAGLEYRHLPALGGRRKGHPESMNLGWRNVSFRAYADYMQTEPFQQGLSTLMALAADKTTTIMCAEAVPWRCHRSLIADALTSRNWEVRHIMTPTKADPHRLTPFAKVKDGLLVYPAPATEESDPTLF